mgnify:CR=1 FL=1
MPTETNMTIEQFIEKHNLELEIVGVPYGEVKDEQPSIAYRLRIKKVVGTAPGGDRVYGKTVVDFQYRMGYGHADWGRIAGRSLLAHDKRRVIDAVKANKRVHSRHHQLIADLAAEDHAARLKNFKTWNAVSDHDYRKRTRPNTKGLPKLAEALDCLITGMEYTSFSEWCDSFGCDEDSRKELDAYLLTEKYRSALLGLLGFSGFAELLGCSRL